MLLHMGSHGQPRGPTPWKAQREDSDLRLPKMASNDLLEPVTVPINHPSETLIIASDSNSSPCGRDESVIPTCCAVLRTYRAELLGADLPAVCEGFAGFSRETTAVGFERRHVDLVHTGRSRYARCQCFGTKSRPYLYVLIVEILSLRSSEQKGLYNLVLTSSLNPKSNTLNPNGSGRLLFCMLFVMYICRVSTCTCTCRHLMYCNYICI